ncbi:hypothetical protein LWI28_020216 [Acer negundo]|uniref:Uncharacterized protein n=1 Tax=Acer negundo TaxID=4023 RepID=A0AAD5JMQ5_ACENE|nr:hypothetical protein LWI28_020216 [Acer negundo]
MTSVISIRSAGDSIEQRTPILSEPTKQSSILTLPSPFSLSKFSTSLLSVGTSSNSEGTGVSFAGAGGAWAGAGDTCSGGKAYKDTTMIVSFNNIRQYENRFEKPYKEITDNQKLSSSGKDQFQWRAHQHHSKRNITDKN